MSARTTTAALTIIFGLAIIPFALNAATQQAATVRTVENRTIAVAPDSTVNVTAPDELDFWPESVTITFDTGSREAEPGRDYRWIDENGTVVWLNTSDTQTETQAEITIDYRVLQRDTTTAIVGLYGPIAALLWLLGLVAAAGFALLLLDRI